MFEVGIVEMQNIATQIKAEKDAHAAKGKKK